MNEAATIRFVGLDVHRDTIAIAVALRDGQPAEVPATLPNDVAALIKRLERLGPAESLRCCYEAGPTGFGLARGLNRLIESGREDSCEGDLLITTVRVHSRTTSYTTSLPWYSVRTYS
jgi:hypothetical protein